MEVVRSLEPRRVEVFFAPERMAAEILAEVFEVLLGDDGALLSLSEPDRHCAQARNSEFEFEPEEILQ